MNYIENRPWGSFEIVLESENYKIKKIIVKPHSRISLQYHLHRNETWVIVSGEGLITRDNSIIHCKTGTTTNIYPKMTHRIENTGNENLIFIEVQTGKYLGEDDIVRLNDDFGRI